MSGAALVLFDDRLRGLLALLGGGEYIDSDPPPRAEISAIRGREPESWRRLYSETRDDLYRYALARLGRAEDAEDAVGDIFEEALASAHRLEDRGLPARAWLYGIARNVVGRHRRSRFRRPPHVAIELFDGGQHDGQLAPEIIDLLREVEALPGRYSEVVTLRFLHGLTLAETAHVLGATIATVKSLQFRAVQQLRERLDVPLARIEGHPFPSEE